jgi:hypothetical protein
MLSPPNLRMVTCTFALALTAPLWAASQVPIEPYRLELDAPIETWDEAIPLGNGLTGGLLWGAENIINLSLDRGDLWDERLPTLYDDDDWN